MPEAPTSTTDGSTRGPAAPNAGEPPRSAPRWWFGLGIVLALVAFRGLLSFESAQSASRELEDWFFAASDTSPIVVLALSGWLLYRRWDRLLELPDSAFGVASGRFAWLAIALLVAGGGVLVWATYTGATDLLAVSLLLVGGGLVTMLKGPRALRVIWLPGLLLLFAIPLPPALLNAVIYQFQLWTGQWAGFLLHLLGSSAFVSGDLILRPRDTFSIIEGCSGMRSVETLTMLSILLVDVLARRGLHALILVVVAPLMAFGMNGLRVLTLIFNPHSEIAAIHNLQGVAVLLCGLGGLLLVDILIERVTGVRRDRAPAGSGPAISGEDASIPLPARPVAVGVAALAVCALLSLLVPRYEPRSRAGLGLVARVGSEIGTWQGAPLSTDREFLGSVWFREQIHARYRNGADEVDLFMGLGSRDERGTTFLSPKTGLPGSGWTVLDRGPLGATAEAPEGDWRLLRARARRVLVHHWYLDTAGVGRETLRSLLALDSSPFRLGDDGLVIRISTQMDGPGLSGVESARERLIEFRKELRRALGPLRNAVLTEAISRFSHSRKSCSLMLVMSQSRIVSKTGTYGTPGAGTRLATQAGRYTGVPPGLEVIPRIRQSEPEAFNGSGRSRRA